MKNTHRLQVSEKREEKVDLLIKHTKLALPVNSVLKTVFSLVKLLKGSSLNKCSWEKWFVLLDKNDGREKRNKLEDINGMTLLER